jgi:opacity protein-like surface antigen
MCKMHEIQKVRKIIAVLLFMFIFTGCGFLWAQTPIKKPPRTGIGFKGGVFGIPDQLLDVLIYEHPRIEGYNYAFEIRSYGSRGPKSVFSGIYSFEYSKMSGDGPWRDEKEHRTLAGTGEVTQINLTATIIMSLFPRSPVHPYIGGGLGVGRISIWYEGTYTDEVGTEISDRYEDERIIPVIHVPFGLIFNFNDRVEIRLEGGFKNGFYIGGALVINF